MRFQIEPRVFQKKYCCICGKKMGRKIICVHKEYTYKPFSINFLKERKRAYMLVLLAYKCESCKYLIEYVNQKKISTAQKETGENILSNGKKIIQKNKIL